MSEKVHCVPRSPQPGHRVNNPTDNPDACKAIDEFFDRYNQRPFRTLSEELAGAARHGGGAFTGKDASKLDRSAAYFARHVAREIVKAGLARRAELQVAYAIGVAESVSLLVETFGTGDPVAAPDYAARFDFRPAAMTVQITGRSFRLNEAALQRGRNPAATTTTTAPAETAPRVETQP